jgi:heme ABC exporter ATP-binding subunit CcmA
MQGVAGGAPVAPALRMWEVAKSYGRTQVLRNIELEVAAGESVALLGANGSGKTTLLRVAATLARPSAGSVHVAGIDAGREPERARGRLSFLTQDAPLYPELTPLEHVRWWARAQGIPSPGAAHLLHGAGLAGVDAKPVRTLSRGQRQRLALTLAFLPDRPLLLLDEPFAALDEAGQSWLEERLQQRHRTGQAILFTAHDHGHARKLADRTVHLRDGMLERPMVAEEVEDR